MTYRIEEVAKLAKELGFTVKQVTADRVDVVVNDDVLVFLNYRENAKDDDLMAFEGTPWHSHGQLQLGTGNNTYIECDELDVLIGLSTGEIVIVTLLLDGVVQDRWLDHKNEPLELQYMQTNEELRVSKARL